MRFIAVFVLGMGLFASAGFAHPGHAEHMIVPSLRHVLSDPMHLVFLAGVVGVGFLGYRVLRRL